MTQVQVAKAEISIHRQIQGGQPCFAGTRIPLVAVASFEEDGYTAEEIAAEYPSLTMSQIAVGMAVSFALRARAAQENE